MYIPALYGFHLIYFISYGVSSFFPKYFGEIGLLDSQIGILASIPAIIGVLLQPYWGSLTDRLRFKKTLLIGLLTGLGVVCVFLNYQQSFLMLLPGMICYQILQLPIAPIYSTISLEYLQDLRRPYGPIRMVGTIGYQLGALLVGFFFTHSLQGIYGFLAAVVFISCFLSFLLPPVEGHQHGKQKVSVRVLLQDKHILLLLAMVLVGTITSQFYLAFFGKHLGDLGIDNSQTGIILIASVLLEIPFLFSSHKIARKTSIWNWLLVGFAINAVRFAGLAFTKSVPVIIFYQLLGMSVMACFEFFPLLYLNILVPDALKGSAQNALMIVSFGISKVIGSLIGGFISQRIGIPAMFLGNAVLLVMGICIFWKATRRAIREEGNLLTQA